MTPVIQTLFGDKKGNCLSACIASILEISIDKVPCWADEKNWADAVSNWLYKNYGLRYLEVSRTDHIEYFSEQSECFYIMSGKSPRGNFWHAVVGHKGKMVHDPHPDNKGLEKFETISFLVKE